MLRCPGTWGKIRQIRRAGAELTEPAGPEDAAAREHVVELRRVASDEATEISARHLELTANDTRVTVRERFGERRGDARGDQRLGVVVHRQVRIANGAAGPFRHGARELGHRERAVASELVDRVFVTSAGEHGRRGACIVVARRSRNAALARRTEERAVSQRGREILRVVFHVPTISENGERKLRRSDRSFRRDVIRGETHAGGVGARDARVDELCDARSLRRADHRDVLRAALAGLAAGNEQDPLGACERGVEAFGLVVVRSSDDDAAFRKVGDLLRVARGRDDAIRRRAFEQRTDHQPTQLSRGTRYDDHGGPVHFHPFGVLLDRPKLTIGKYLPNS